MNLTYAQRKRMRSLATQHLRAYDSLAEAKELNDIYHSDFIHFLENLLVDLCGFKREVKEPEIHRPRPVGERPKRRKPGQRPPRIGEVIESGETSLSKHENIEKEIERTVDPLRPDWYKKAWRKAMMQVHPDRLDLVSKSEIDKLERLMIASRLRNDSGPELLIACCNLLELDLDLPIFEQEKSMRIKTKKLHEELGSMQKSIPWVWAESIIDNNVRAQLMKQVLNNNGYDAPGDSELLRYITEKLV